MKIEFLINLSYILNFSTLTLYEKLINVYKYITYKMPQTGGIMIKT